MLEVLVFIAMKGFHDEYAPVCNLLPSHASTIVSAAFSAYPLQYLPPGRLHVDRCHRIKTDSILRSMHAQASRKCLEKKIRACEAP